MNTHPDYMNFDGGVRQRSEDGRQPATQTADKKVRRSEDQKVGRLEGKKAEDSKGEKIRK